MEREERRRGEARRGEVTFTFLRLQIPNPHCCKGSWVLRAPPAPAAPPGEPGLLGAPTPPILPRGRCVCCIAHYGCCMHCRDGRSLCLWREEQPRSWRGAGLGAERC